jgi:hypothetical protein
MGPKHREGVKDRTESMTTTSGTSNGKRKQHSFSLELKSNRESLGWARVSGQLPPSQRGELAEVGSQGLERSI